jgi:glutamate dehydrogenase
MKGSNHISPPHHLPAPTPLAQAMQQEAEKFQEYYLWLEKAMPAVFFDEISRESLILITHGLIGFNLQNYFTTINLRNAAIVICLDSADADVRILENYALYGIKNYQTYLSRLPAPFASISDLLRIATIDFTEAIESVENPYPTASKEKLYALLQETAPEFSKQDFNRLIGQVSARFLNALPMDRLALALYLLSRAETRDNCQYEVRYEDEWAEDQEPSMQIVIAWRNIPRYNFLYRLARVVLRHKLKMERVNATYVNPYSKNSVLIMVVNLYGSNRHPVWEVADIVDFLREFSTIKYFDTIDAIGDRLVDKGIVSGNIANLLRTMVTFIHQSLVHLDANLYRLDNIEEAFCRHPELTVQLSEAFKYKFDPNFFQLDRFLTIKQDFLEEVAQLDTGQEENDTRRKNVLRQAMNFIAYTLKTNFYRLNYTALSFRLDPTYLKELPFDRSSKFPEIPYAIFFIKGMHFFGFHIRFKDLARGGLRTIYPEQIEQMLTEQNMVFAECYHLAWTQHKKNKDIPEGGSKGIIFLKTFEQIDSDSLIFRKELEYSKLTEQEVDAKIAQFRQEQKLEFLYQAQRAFIDSLMSIVNCDANGKIRAKYIIDYWKKPEYLYLGPDENMHDSIIQWIAQFSKKHHYKPGIAFISSKPLTGINHKEYGVTSLGVNVYMHQALEAIGIHPEQDIFTVKLSGGPDGDVAGNQLLNLYRFYPHTAKVVAITDKTGTICDQQGLDLSLIKQLFYQGKGIAFYPPDQLSDGSFLVDKQQKRYPIPYVQETRCWRKKDNQLLEEWLSGSETNHLLRFNVHQTKADVFIPAGGRPRTLNESNIQEFLDEKGKPTSKIIIEGANLYLNPQARQLLEEKGVLIVKDSSANKGGVICSSFEVLCGLALTEETFLANKETLVKEILERIEKCALDEARLLLQTYQTTQQPLTLISEKISDRINGYKYQILEYLESFSTPLDHNLEDPFIRCFLNYFLPILKNQFADQLLKEIPDSHKKAIIACYLAAHLVYHRGLDWSPSIVDILPLILSDAF